VGGGYYFTSSNRVRVGKRGGKRSLFFIKAEKKSASSSDPSIRLEKKEGDRGRKGGEVAGTVGHSARDWRGRLALHRQEEKKGEKGRKEKKEMTSQQSLRILLKKTT